MTKLKLFSIIAESMARVYCSDPVKSAQFFTETAKELYPDNLHRREWALSNMQMFYTQESERIVIMNNLRGYTSGDSILDEIRRRKAAES